MSKQTVEQVSSIVIRPVLENDWVRLESLWLSLYTHQRDQGMQLELPTNAYQLWVESQQSVLDRFAFVFVAEEAESVVGFIAGKIRSLPQHFGGQPVGYVGELFVVESHRNRGIAGRLLSTARLWFREREISRIELQVVVNNSQALNFYARQGWKTELTQMVWQEGVRDLSETLSGRE